MPTAELIEAVRELLDAVPTTGPAELGARVEALRAQIEEALLGPEEPEAISYLSDAVVAVSLYAREAQRGRTERAEECLEMGRLFLVAAASPPAPVPPGEGGTAEGRDNAKGTAPGRGRG
jgi:hypothetical protein